MRLQGGGLHAVVVPGIGGRLLSLKNDQGVELLQVAGDLKKGVDPRAGGYEEYSSADYRSPGWRESYTVSNQSANAVTLTATFDNGITLERRYELTADGALKIHSTATDKTKAEQTGGLRIHPCFTLVDPRKAKLVAGANMMDLKSGATAAAEQYFHGANRPQGEWKVQEILPGTDLVARFTGDTPNTVYVNWSGAEKRINLEMWTADTKLAPGASLTFDVEYRWVKR